MQEQIVEQIPVEDVLESVEDNVAEDNVAEDKVAEDNDQHVVVSAASRGMSLIEILVVLTIIGMIVSGISVMVMGQFSESQLKIAKNETMEIEKGISMYMLTHKNKCPADLATLGKTVKIKTDPWDGEYAFKCKGEHAKIEVTSAGPDGEMGTEDDIHNYETE